MEVMELREGLEDATSEEEAAEVRERNRGGLWILGGEGKVSVLNLIVSPPSPCLYSEAG